MWNTDLVVAEGDKPAFATYIDLPWKQLSWPVFYVETSPLFDF